MFLLSSYLKEGLSIVITQRLSLRKIHKREDNKISVGSCTKADKLQVFNVIMDARLVILTWICLITTCHGDDTDIRTMNQRLPLTDPYTLLNHIEALQREITSLKSQVTSRQSEINAMRNRLVKRNPGNFFFCKKSCRFFCSSIFIWTRPHTNR